LLGLGCVARAAQRLQVGFVIVATFSLWCIVINLASKRHTTLLLAVLTQTSIAF
jgi:hypothetical protein